MLDSPCATRTPCRWAVPVANGQPRAACGHIGQGDDSSGSELSTLPAADAAVCGCRHHACTRHDDAQMPWHLASSQGRD